MGEEMRINSLLIIVLFCIGIISLMGIVTAVKPTQIIDSGCEVRTPTAEFVKINRDITSHVHVINITAGSNNFLTNESTSCILHLYNETGNHLIQTNYSWEAGGMEWEFSIAGGNFSKPETYSFYIQCVSSDSICAVSGSVDATTTGTTITTAQAIIYLISFTFLIFIFGLLILALFQIPKDIKDDEGFVVNVSKLEYLRPIVKGLAWIVLTGIVFIISNITIAYLSTGLMGSFLFLIFTLMMLSNLVIIPLMIIRMIQRITLSKDMLGLIERGVKF